MTREVGTIKKKKSNKKALITMLFAVYLSFIFVSFIPYIAQHDLHRGTLTDGEYESHLVFPENGTYGHYKNVVLFDSNSTGKIDLRYTFADNTLFIENLENIKELVIDCEMMYENKCEEVLESEPSSLEEDYYKTYFLETNNGLFTVIINTDTPLENLQFLEIPQPKSVLVNNQEWWDNQTTKYTLEDNDITITNIPAGSTTVKIYFKAQVETPPVAFFTASRHIALQEVEITFNASRSYDEDGVIIDYLWDFGDGAESYGELIEHTYTELGNFLVRLTVRDNDDLEDTYLRNISIVLSDTDSDNDFVPDLSDPKPYTYTDTDSDGLSDEFEDIISRTDKNREDTDIDGWDDKVEWDSGTDPNNPDDHPYEKGEGDGKGEGFDIFIIIPIILLLLVILIPIFVMIKRKRRARELERLAESEAEGEIPLEDEGEGEGKEEGEEKAL
jgi:hypothetical protein